jgi:hypothetical protein
VHGERSDEEVVEERGGAELERGSGQGMGAIAPWRGSGQAPPLCLARCGSVCVHMCSYMYSGPCTWQSYKMA